MNNWIVENCINYLQYPFYIKVIDIEYIKE